MVEIDNGMPAKEYDRWKLYWNAEPWGAMRDNAHAGLIAAMLRNIHRKKGMPPVGADDFMLVSKEESDQKKLARIVGFLRRSVKPKKGKGKKSG